MKKNSSGEFLYLSFIVTGLKIRFVEKLQKIDMATAQIGLPSSMEPLEGHI